VRFLDQLATECGEVVAECGDLVFSQTRRGGGSLEDGVSADCFVDTTIVDGVSAD
jgi:hypothetical protein